MSHQNRQKQKRKCMLQSGCVLHEIASIYIYHRSPKTMIALMWLRLWIGLLFVVLLCYVVDGANVEEDQVRREKESDIVYEYVYFSSSSNMTVTSCFTMFLKLLCNHFHLFTALNWMRYESTHIQIMYLFHERERIKKGWKL